MRKNGKKIVKAILISALVLTGAAVFHAPKMPTIKVFADENNSNLLLPSSYEQYLPLLSPKDVAITADYTAIADGNSIYVYDKKDGIYRAYEHTENQESAKNTVTKLQFDHETETLYFLDASTYLYTLNVKELENTATAPTATGFSCSTFAIHENELYFTTVSENVSQISKTSLSTPDISTSVTLVNDLAFSPTIAFWNGELYYTNAKTYLHKIAPDAENAKPAQICSFSSSIVSMNITNGIFTCSDILGDFYAYSLPDLSLNINASEIPPLASASGGYSAISSFGEEIYVIKNNTVRNFSLQTNSFTDYEIGGQSDSPHRINGGTAIHLSEEKLFIADSGNERISVYDVQSNSFLSPVNSTMPIAFLASTANTVVAANKEQAIIYDLSDSGYGAQLSLFDDFNGELIGVANVYGKYYFATESNFCYVASYNAETAVWEWTETKKTSTRYPRQLCSDAYGYLYIANATGVYRFTEESFLSSTAEGEPIYDSMPQNTEKVLIDYAGKGYALSKGVLYALDTLTPYEFGTVPVYTSDANLISFAFGVEENATYLLYKENYIVKTKALALPTVKTISVGGADTDIFSETGAVFTVVETTPNALLVKFDLSLLNGAEFFPYLAYERSTEAKTALRIGQTQQYDVIAIFDEQKKQYDSYLVLSDSCKELPENEFHEGYAQEEQKTAYLTNDILLYKFPYLTELLPVCALKRSEEITLLGEITRLDNDYYHVSYQTENGEIKTGYVPQCYVSPFNGEPPETETRVNGANSSDKDALWRLAYLLLGTGAIFIIIDYMILHKQNKDDHED